MKIVDDDRYLTVPLFHGTSTAFFNSIKATGLGSENPHIRLKTLNLISDLYDIAIQVPSFCDEYQLDCLEIKSMISQSVSGCGFNYRHGSTYLTPSKDTAVRYAIHNPYGSELLSTGLKFYGKLRDLKISGLDNIRLSYSLALSYLDKIFEPILVRIERISIDNLKSESGGNPELVTQRMKESAEKGLKVFWDQSNFELINPIQPDCLTFFQIHLTNDDTFRPQYKLDLL